MTTTNGLQIVIESTEEIPNTVKFALEMVDNIESDEIPTCRICMEPHLEDSDPNMPLGCGCCHSLGQAHKNCLIQWFCRQRYTSVFNHNGLPNYKKCEICRKNLSPSIQRLINVHWMPFFQQEMMKFIISIENERMAAHFRMTWRDMGYFILGAIFIMIIILIGICMGLSISFVEI